MKTIYKYPISIGSNHIGLPKNSTILHFGIDGAGYPCIWVLIDTKEEEGETIHLKCIGTGWDLDEILGDSNYAYIGTTIMSNGFVWHLLEVE